VENDCQAHKLNREDAMDRNRWRKQMTDDHDRCEWVNVSSGTGSPGLSQTNPESRKMVVCVCVHACMRACDDNAARVSDVDVIYIYSKRGSSAAYIESASSARRKDEVKPLAAVIAICFLHCFDIVGWVAKGHRPIKTHTTYLQMFSFRTHVGRKLRGLCESKQHYYYSSSGLCS